MDLTAIEFTGRAWPAASITGQAQIGNGVAFDIEASGKGREYHLDHSASFWMSFAEVDAENADHVLAFLRRRGDPFGQLDASRGIDTRQWGHLIDLLKPVADCWTGDGDRRVRYTHWIGAKPAAEHLLASAYIDGFAYRPEYDPKARITRVRVIADTLASFMVASALADLDRSGGEVRRCAHCAEWFDPPRQDSRYCSASCRTLAAAERRGAH